MKLTPALTALIYVFVIFQMSGCSAPEQDAEKIPVKEISDVVEVQPAPDQFGIPAELYSVTDRRVRNGESLSTILGPHGINGLQVNNLVAASRDIFNVRRIVSGRPIHFYTNPETGELDYMVYEQNRREYVVFDLSETAVLTGEREMTRELRRIEGEINGSLYVSLIDQGGSPALVSLLSNVYAWQVDFYRIQRGDRFAVLYEELSIDGEPVGVGRIKAAQLTHRNTDYDAFFFGQNGESDYFDMEGNSLRKAFLRAPLEYSRISSRFTNRRYHPVLKRNMPHHGTDYAAPTGTPIRAVGDGQIIHAGYDRNNGNYIRIRHNSVYETGYLHMSRLAGGMRNGTRVQQGQIIGFVGATGLATGPHLCFRFWQHGTPVDPYRVEMPPSNPVAEAYRSDFEQEKQRLVSLLFPESKPEPPRPVILAASDPYNSGTHQPMILIQ